MKIFKKYLCISAITTLFIGTSCSYAQEITKVLDYESYMDIVMKNHPVSVQADLQLNYGEAILQTAKGQFDPKLFTSLDQKYFDGSKYYSLLDAGLKIPTWLGIEVKSGFEQNEGKYMNPENRTPQVGLFYLGSSFNLGKGLFIDERRAELKKGKLYLAGSEIERRLLLNELRFEASNAYWLWLAAHTKYSVIEEGTTLARQRYEAVVSSVLLGDRPSIDTLEASIQYQLRSQELLQAGLERTISRAKVNQFLWLEGQIPMELEETVTPSVIDNQKLVNQTSFVELDSLITNHPELLLTENKINILAVDLKLKKEMLKPELEINYNALTEPIGADILTNYNVANYKWGLTFNMPLFLRKERGSVALTETKITDTKLDLELKKAELRFKTEKAVNTYRNSQEQITLFQKTSGDYRKMFEAEQQLFFEGESSIFLVNARENAFINAKIKLIEIDLKNRLSASELNYILVLIN